jgi:response regulator RpfG family c-di-GMP phosphodiesterase
VNGRGTHFDPAVVDAFLSVAEDFKRTSDEPMPN